MIDRLDGLKARLRGWLSRTPPPHSPTQRVLAALARKGAAVRFVQIGSNDAKHGDPLRAYIRRHGWRGTMIEPVPYVFARLVDEWRTVPGLRFLNCAVSEEAGERTFYYLAQTSDPLPPWYDQLGSFDRQHLLKHAAAIADIDARICAQRVPCRAVADVVGDDVDLVHCDVEGYDDRIVLALLRAGRRPAVVIFEHVHLDPLQRERVDRALAAAGYLVIDDHPDSVAVRPDVIPAAARLRGAAAADAR